MTIALFLLTSCKKDKLTGDAKSLIGTWQWVQTNAEFSTTNPSNTGITKTIEFIEKGKYEIKKNSKRLEGGRVTYSEITNAFGHFIRLEFLRNALFTKKQELPGKSNITQVGADTLYISENVEWSDQPWHIYVRQN